MLGAEGGGGGDGAGGADSSGNGGCSGSGDAGGKEPADAPRSPRPAPAAPIAIARSGGGGGSGGHAGGLPLTPAAERSPSSLRVGSLGGAARFRASLEAGLLKRGGGAGGGGGGGGVADVAASSGKGGESQQQQLAQQQNQQQRDQQVSAQSVGPAAPLPSVPPQAPAAAEPADAFEARLRRITGELGAGEGVTALLRAARAAEEAAAAGAAAAVGGASSGSGGSAAGALAPAAPAPAPWLVADEAEDARLLSLSGLLSAEPAGAAARLRRDLFGATLDFVAALSEASRCLVRYAPVRRRKGCCFEGGRGSDWACVAVWGTNLPWTAARHDPNKRNHTLNKTPQRQADRLPALRGFLRRISAEVEAAARQGVPVLSPLGARGGAAARPERVLRLLPDECVVFSSAEKVPFLLVFEVLGEEGSGGGGGGGGEEGGRGCCACAECAEPAPTAPALCHHQHECEHQHDRHRHHRHHHANGAGAHEQQLDGVASPAAAAPKPRAQPPPSPSTPELGAARPAKAAAAAVVQQQQQQQQKQQQQQQDEQPQQPVADHRSRVSGAAALDQGAGGGRPVRLRLRLRLLRDGDGAAGNAAPSPRPRRLVEARLEVSAPPQQQPQPPLPALPLEVPTPQRRRRRVPSSEALDRLAGSLRLDSLPPAAEVGPPLVTPSAPAPSTGAGGGDSSSCDGVGAGAGAAAPAPAAPLKSQQQKQQPQPVARSLLSRLLSRGAPAQQPQQHTGKAGSEAAAAAAQPGTDGGLATARDGSIGGVDNDEEAARRERERERERAAAAAVFGERWADKARRLRAAAGARAAHPSWAVRALIVKSGDDCRQEALALQLVAELGAIWAEEGLPLAVRPFEVLATSDDTALIELVPDAVSVHTVKARGAGGAGGGGGGAGSGGASLSDFFERRWGPASAPAGAAARRRFAESAAAYGLVTYLLQVKDRHNGNIMLDAEGRLVHIDFGFMLTNAPGRLPGGVGFEASPMKVIGLIWFGLIDLVL